jgi:hypothetical protein
VILAVFAIAIMVRFMVDMMLEVLFYHYRLNHIRLPEPGWKLEAVKIVLTATIISPVIGFMSMPH